MLAIVLKNNEKKRDSKRKVPTRVCTIGGTFVKWSRNTSQPGANTQERLQRGQLAKIAELN